MMDLERLNVVHKLESEMQMLEQEELNNLLASKEHQLLRANYRIEELLSNFKRNNSKENDNEKDSKIDKNLSQKGESEHAIGKVFS